MPEHSDGKAVNFALNPLDHVFERRFVPALGLFNRFFKWQGHHLGPECLRLAQLIGELVSGGSGEYFDPAPFVGSGPRAEFIYLA